MNRNSCAWWFTLFCVTIFTILHESRGLSVTPEDLVAAIKEQRNAFTSFSGTVVYSETGDYSVELALGDPDKKAERYSINESYNVTGYSLGKIRASKYREETKFGAKTGTDFTFGEEFLPRQVEYAFDGEKLIEFWPEKNLAFVEPDGGDKTLVEMRSRCDPSYWFNYVASCVTEIVENKGRQLSVTDEPGTSRLHMEYAPSNGFAGARVDCYLDKAGRSYLLRRFELSVTLPDLPSRYAKGLDIDITYEQDEATQEYHPAQVVSVSYSPDGNVSGRKTCTYTKMIYHQVTEDDQIFHMTLPSGIVFEDRRLGLTVTIGKEAEKFARNIEKIEKAVSSFDETSAGLHATAGSTSANTVTNALSQSRAPQVTNIGSSHDSTRLLRLPVFAALSLCAMVVVIAIAWRSRK